MSEQDIAYGGQAVIGGVMIQSPKGWSQESGIKIINSTNIMKKAYCQKL